MTLTVVDVSHHQNDAGPIDFGALFHAVGAFLCKASERTDYADPAYNTNMPAARAGGGVNRGSYHFAGSSLTGRVGDPTAEADHYCWVANHQPGEVLVLDYEPKIPPPDPDGWCATFLTRVRDRTGVVPMTYMSESVARSQPWTRTRATNTGLWVARYGPNTGTRPDLTLNVGAWQRPAMWQYTSNGTVPGVRGKVDLSEFYGTAQAWARYGGA